MTRYLAVVLLALSFVGCESPFAVSDDLVRIRVQSRSLQLTNTSDAPLHYLAAERESLALLDYIFCSDPAKFSGLAPHETVVIDFAAIIGYGPNAREISVAYWHLSPRAAGSGYERRPLRSSIVRLR